MLLKELLILNFTKFRRLALEFRDKYLVILQGPNGAGKTTVIEAIRIACTGKTSYPLSTLPYNKTNTFKIRAVVTRHTSQEEYFEATYTFKAGISIRWNNSPVPSLRSFYGTLPVWFISGKSINVVRGAPNHKRDFWDQLLALLDPEYINLLYKYNRYLQAKNKVLRKNPEDDKLIQVYTSALISISNKIQQTRKKATDLIQGMARKFTHTLLPSYSDIEINYKPAPVNNWINLIEKEKQLGYCLTGIQRDTWNITVTQDARSLPAQYLSQGESSRLAILMYVSAWWILCMKLRTNPPLLLVDDWQSFQDKYGMKLLMSLLEHLHDELSNRYSINTQIIITDHNAINPTRWYTFKFPDNNFHHKHQTINV